MNGILSDPKSKEAILNDIASKSNGDVAKKYNLTTGRISQIKSENIEIINQKKTEIIKLLPSVVDTIKSDVSANQKLSKRIDIDPYNVDSNKIALKNTLDKTNVNILKIANEDDVGIFPSNTMYNFGDDNSQHLTVISESYQKYLDFQNDNPYDQDGKPKAKTKDL